MKRTDFYRSAVESLGIFPTINFVIQKRRRSDLLRLTSKHLDHAVIARRGTSDLGVFNQILIEREYRCLDDLRNPDVILDLGANAGYSSAYFLSRFPSCTLIAVEPDPGNFALLQRNVRPYDDRCKTLQAAIWPRKERLSFDRRTMMQGAEWGRRIEANDDSVPVAAVTMPELIALAGQQRISLLKIDIEGSESALFSSACDEWIDHVDNIVIELHGDHAERTFHAAIERRGFALSHCGELTVCRSG